MSIDIEKRVPPIAMAPDPLSVPSKLLAKVTIFQRISAVLAIVSAIMALGFTISYCKNTNLAAKYLGGLNWGELIFNWHPVLMVNGLILCSLTALVSYRLFPFPKWITKSMHGFLHMCGVISLSVGFSAVYIGNNNKDKNSYGVYYSNFCSIHSLLGLTAIMLYGQNFFLGVYHFLMPFASLESRKWYMSSHVFLGLIAFFVSCFAALTGIMELETEFLCFYDCDTADTNPAENYHLLPAGCKTLNGMGICILSTAFFAAFALWDVNTPVARNDNGDLTALLNDDRK